MSTPQENLAAALAAAIPAALAQPIADYVAAVTTGIHGGATWSSGPVDPTDATPVIGDFYVNTITGNVFRKAS